MNEKPSTVDEARRTLETYIIRSGDPKMGTPTWHEAMDALDALIAAVRAECASEPLDVERLAAVMDLHWMNWNPLAQTATCSAGDWQFDADRDITVGDHFAPFSHHVAEVVDAALREKQP